jgi:hypothetical protein
VSEDFVSARGQEKRGIDVKGLEIAPPAVPNKGLVRSWRPIAETSCRRRRLPRRSDRTGGAAKSMAGSYLAVIDAI